MTTYLYQKLLLVNHIPAIEGITGVQDLIKAFAYRGDLYMEKAKQFRKRCFQVLRYIERINCTVFIKGDCIDSYKHGGRVLYKNKLLFYSRFCTVCGDYMCVDLIKYWNRHSTTSREYKYPRCKCFNLIT